MRDGADEMNDDEAVREGPTTFIRTMQFCEMTITIAVAVAKTDFPLVYLVSVISERPKVAI